MTEPFKVTHVPNCSQSELERLYVEQNFAEKLAKCRPEIMFDRPRKPEDTRHSELTERERGVKFHDPETDETIAVIIWYTNIFGDESRVLRCLRTGNIVHDARQRPA